MIFCAEYSRAGTEPLFGTAKQVKLWLLIEHPGRWEREDSESLPTVARNAVVRARAQFPQMRLGLIRQDGRVSSPLRGFLAIIRERQSRLFAFSIHTHEDLETLDFERTLEGPPDDRRLFLVCTHGLHDRCCAKFGNSLFESMRQVAGNDAWQVSHVGGCRFVPNIVSLPEGIVYGRVQQSDCESIVQAAGSGRVIARLLRGRSCYPKPVQAAEYFARIELGGTSELSLESAEESGDEWQVVFRRGGTRVSLRLAVESAGILTFKSCSSDRRSPRPSFKLLDLSPLPGRSHLRFAHLQLGDKSQ
jgi:hypothetical protein